MSVLQRWSLDRRADQCPFVDGVVTAQLSSNASKERALKFGMMLPHYRPVASTGAITRFAKEAEDMGYDSVWVTGLITVPNYVVDRFGPPFYESLTVLAYVAGFTSTVRLGSSVIGLPLRNPIHLAKVASSIDSLSQGRLILGVGTGEAGSEARQLGVPGGEIGDRSDEAIRIFKELWTNDNPSIQSKNYQLSDIQFVPKPVQKPHLPIWIGGNSRRALRRAVEFGDAWHPSRASVECLAEMTPHLWRLAERAGRDPQEIGITTRQPMKIVSDPGLSSGEWPLIGTAENVIDQVGRFRDAGVGCLVMDTFGNPELYGETADSILTTMERFATEVIPRFPEP